MNEVIVIGRNYATDLSVIRSLGMAGYTVKLVCTSTLSLGIEGKSRYVSQTVYIDMDQESVFDAMEKLRGGAERILVVPTSDKACKALDQQADGRAAHYILPSVDYQGRTLTEMMDKMLQKELAAQCGMKVAKGECVSTSGPVSPEEAEKIGFPCFVKPLSSANVIGCKSIFATCESIKELNGALSHARDKKCETVLAEQFLQVDEELCAYGVADRGRVYLPACVVTFRGGSEEHRGVAAEGKVVPLSTLGAIAGQIEEMAARIRLSGLFCVDLLRCGDDVYFSEMNLRSGGSIFGVTLAGANLPGALADLAYGKPDFQAPEVKREVVFLNERIEFDACFNGHISVREYRAHMAGNQERIVESKTDPKPWQEFRRMTIRRLLKKRLLGLLGK